MEDFIHFAHALSGPERGTRLADDAAIASALHRPDLAWLHLKADAPGTGEWIRTHLDYFDPSILSALLQPETRPRVRQHEDGLMLILRAINLETGEEPEDMVSLRLWLDPARAVSLSRRRVAAIDAMAEEFAHDPGPERVSGLLIELLRRIVTPIEDRLIFLDEQADALEDVVIEGPDPQIRADIADLRHELTMLRRHIAPQRDALADLGRADVSWLSKSDRRRIHEMHERMVRAVEDLDEYKDRMLLLRDELTNAMSERLNRHLYVLSVISVVFLPLGFLTGLMGINLAGMPGADWAPAFWVFTSALAGLGAILLAVLIWRRWL